MFRKMNTRAANRIKFHAWFVEYITLRVIRVVIGRSKSKNWRYLLYKKLRIAILFSRSLNSFCVFTGMTRSTYLGFISRHKLKEYTGYGLIVGVKKSTY